MRLSGEGARKELQEEGLIVVMDILAAGFLAFLFVSFLESFERIDRGNSGLSRRLSRIPGRALHQRAMLKSVKEVYEERGLTEGITEEQKKPHGGEYNFSLPCGFFDRYYFVIQSNHLNHK